MKINILVFNEIFERKNQLFSSLLAISLGIAVIVGIKNITVYSEKAVSRELDTLGANILILPKSATVQNYYSADFQNEEIPEDYVTILVNSDLQGIDNLSPKLSIPIEINNNKTILTGILPKNEFNAKSYWQGALGIFSRMEGCGTVTEIPGVTDSKKNIVRKRVIEDLGKDQILVGAEISSLLNAKEGESLKINNKEFKIEAILPATGTVDDNRIFAHLHAVQDMFNKKSALNAIEIVGCCSQISQGLILKINKLLPDAKVVTISQIVQTQLNTNKLINNLSLILLIIIIIVGGASIANYMYANVYERRREIGIFIAMGAKTSWIVRLFLLKAFLIGAASGVAGYIIGTLMAMILGPRFASIPVLPIPMLGVYGFILSIILSLIASIFPVIKASKIDPYIIIQED